jgi:hypothetical protein
MNNVSLDLKSHFMLNWDGRFLTKHENFKFRTRQIRYFNSFCHCIILLRLIRGFPILDKKLTLIYHFDFYADRLIRE